MEIKSTRNVENNGIKIVVFGASGTGKTTLISTLDSPLIISAEGGLLSLKNLKEMPYIEVKTIADLEEAYKFCASDSAKEFKTICLDSISEISEIVLSNELKKAGKDPRKAYGEMNNIMISLIRSFRDLNKNIYFSAKEERAKDDNSGISKFEPLMPGRQLGLNLPYMFDEVFRLIIGKTQDGKEYRALQTCISVDADCKDRSGVLDSIERPDLQFVIDKIKAGKVPADNK